MAEERSAVPSGDEQPDGPREGDGARESPVDAPSVAAAGGLTQAQRRRAAARQRAREMRRAGASCAQIAEELGVSRSTAHNWTRLVADLPLTARRQRRADDIERARALRASGLPHQEVARRLGVSVATAYGWVLDVPLPGGRPPQASRRTTEERRATSRRAWEPRLREADAQRQQAKLTAANEVRPITDRELFLAGLVAYWAEGAKDKQYRRQERVVFVNSDPLMITLFRDWLDMLGVERDRRRYRLSIHETADVQRAERFWCALLDLPDHALGKATIKRHNPRTNRLRTGADYRGCLVVGVTRSAELYRQIEGWWYGLAGPGRGTAGPPGVRQGVTLGV